MNRDLLVDTRIALWYTGIPTAWYAGIPTSFSVGLSMEWIELQSYDVLVSGSVALDILDSLAPAMKAL